MLEAAVLKELEPRVPPRRMTVKLRMPNQALLELVKVAVGGPEPNAPSP